jgi:hypothetical protein
MQLPKSMPFLVVITFILGVTVGAIWASAQETTASEHKARVLIKGVDGGDYEAYKPSLVTRVQEALKKEGVYDGEANGKLDESTMNALAEYQRKNGVQASGVPSPKTRERLLKE